MIEINLLPEELKKAKGKPNILPQLLIYIVPAVFALLIIIHLYLGALYLFKSRQKSAVENEWSQLESKRQEVDRWKQQYNISNQYTQQIGQLLQARLTFAKKLESLSDNLPNGIWFNRLNVKDGKFRLEASVVSLKKEQLSLINDFLRALKKDEDFFKDFGILELGHMNVRAIGAFSVMDFVLSGELK